MERVTLRQMFIATVAFYLILAVYHLFANIFWLIDPLMAIAYLSLVYWKKDYLYFGKKEFMLFNVGLLLHNIGFAGLYSLGNGMLGYDVLVHIANSTIGAYLAMNFLCRRYFSKNDRAIAITLSVGLVVLIGIITEIIEFIGFLILGNLGTGIGILNAGSPEHVGQYIDTMKDIIINLFSAIIGATIYRTKALN